MQVSGRLLTCRPKPAVCLANSNGLYQAPYDPEVMGRYRPSPFGLMISRDPRLSGLIPATDTTVAFTDTKGVPIRAYADYPYSRHNLAAYQVKPENCRYYVGEDGKFRTRLNRAKIKVIDGDSLRCYGEKNLPLSYEARRFELCQSRVSARKLATYLEKKQIRFSPSNQYEFVEIKRNNLQLLLNAFIEKLASPQFQEHPLREQIQIGIKDMAHALDGKQNIDQAIAIAVELKRVLLI